MEEFLADLVQERARLDELIALLSERLGQAVPSFVTGSASASTPSPKVDASTGRVDPVSLVAEAEFFGLSQTKAAEAVLKKVGRPGAPRPLKTAVLADALRKGGVEVAQNGILYRSLARSPKFEKVSKGTWGLKEWYPGRATARAKGAEGTEAAEAENLEPLPEGEAYT